MPATLSVDSFVELVRRSRLMSADQLQQVLQELEAEGVQFDTPDALADALVRRELLTSWQVGFLLKGKHNGFFLGSYRFLKMLGKGGMGAVYLAEHERMRRRCAIKVLPNKLIDDSSSVLERFYLEAQAVAALDDPNIVRAYDVNMEMQGKREIHYLVMEFVDGCDLQVLVQRKGPLGYVQVADFARQAASGLAHAHECGLIHRDIKPANLLIDEKGTVKILDLGLARFFDDRLDASLTTTHNESILGTADYLSPEQALDSHNVDTRTDIYSLGCTCYYMLTGHPPFPEGSVAQRLMSHQAKSPTAIEKIRHDVPVDLVTIVERMIAKSPDDRFQTSREVANAFTAWLTQHADEDWKKEHREIVDGSASHARHEPTRARSAAAEETDLELGLAPTEELGLAPTEELGLAPTEDDDTPPAESHSASRAAESDAPVEIGGEGEFGLDQLEELDPLSTAFDTGSPSGGLDNLLNEALDNYPALDSNPNLAAQAGMASGIHGAAKAAPGSASDPNQIQLFKLILIGFAVSVPLAIVILVVSSQLSAPDGSPGVASAIPTQQVPPASDVEEIESPQSTSPATPTASDAEPARTENAATPESTNVVEPSSPPEPPKPEPPKPEPPKPEPTEPEPTEPEPREEPPAKTGPATASTKKKPETVPNATPNAKSAPGNEPPKPPVGQDADEPKPGPPSPERIKELLASLSEVTIKLDRESTRQSFAYDQLVKREAKETMARLKLKVTDEPRDARAAVLTLSLNANKAQAFYIFNLVAELKCRDADSQEVSLCKHEGVVLQVRADALNNTPISVLRNNVSDFYIAFQKEYRQAKEDGE